MPIEWMIKLDSNEGDAPEAFMADAVTVHSFSLLHVFREKTQNEAEAEVVISQIKSHQRFSIMIASEKTTLMKMWSGLQHLLGTTSARVHWLQQRRHDHQPFSVTIALLRHQGQSTVTVQSVTFESVIVSHFRTLPEGYVFDFKSKGKSLETVIPSILNHLAKRVSRILPK